MTSLTLGKTTKWLLKAIALNAIIYIWRYYSMSIDGVNSNIIVYIFQTQIFSNNFFSSCFLTLFYQCITAGWFGWFSNQLSTSCCLTLFYQQCITAGQFACFSNQLSSSTAVVWHFSTNVLLLVSLLDCRGRVLLSILLSAILTRRGRHLGGIGQGN